MLKLVKEKGREERGERKGASDVSSAGVGNADNGRSIFLQQGVNLENQNWQVMLESIPHCPSC